MRVFIALTLLMALASAVTPKLAVTSYPMKAAGHAAKVTIPAVSNADNTAVDTADKAGCKADGSVLVTSAIEVLATATGTSPEIVGVKLTVMSATNCVKDTTVYVAKTDLNDRIEVASNKDIANNPVHVAQDYEIKETDKSFVFAVNNADGASFTADKYLAFACSKSTGDVTLTGKKADSIGFLGQIKKIVTADKGRSNIFVTPVAVGALTTPVALTTFGCDKTDEKEVFVLSPGTNDLITKTKIGTLVAAYTGEAGKDTNSWWMIAETATSITIEMAVTDTAANNQKNQFFFCDAAKDKTAWANTMNLFQAKWVIDATTNTKFTISEFGGDAAATLKDVGCANDTYLYVVNGLEGTPKIVQKIAVPADNSGTATVATVAAVGMAAIAAAL